MAVLVTGAAGFIGSHLVQRLLADRTSVVCLDDFNDFYDPAVKRANIAAAMGKRKCPVYDGDIRDETQVETVFRQHVIEAVVHLAARAGVRPSLEQPALYADVNCRGTLILLEAARQREVPRFVFASSSSVYGNAERVPCVEDDPALRPESPYGATKRAGELFCWNYHHLHGMAVACLRFFTVYGPRQRPDMAIHKFTALLDAGRAVPVFGDGSTERDYTYVDDIVDGIAAALRIPLDFEIINLGNSHTIRLSRLVELIGRALGRKPRLEHRPEQPGDVRITYSDITRARKLLGFSPRTDIEEGIPRFVEWFQAKKSPGGTSRRTPTRVTRKE